MAVLLSVTADATCIPARAVGIALTYARSAAGAVVSTLAAWPAGALSTHAFVHIFTSLQYYRPGRRIATRDNLGVDSAKPSGWRAWLAHAFAVDKYDESSLEPEEKALLTRLAVEINSRGMSTPAIMYIHSQRHMGWLGSQVLVVTEPLFDMAHPFLNPLLKRFGLAVRPEEMSLLISAFEKRFAPEYLVQQIEAAQAGETSLAQNLPVVEEKQEE